MTTLVFLLCGVVVSIWNHRNVENKPKRHNLVEIISINNEEEKSIKAFTASTDSSGADSNEKVSDPLSWQQVYENRKKISDDELQVLLEQDDICKIFTSDVSLKNGVLALTSAPDKIKVDAEKDLMLTELFGGSMEGIESKNENANLILDFYNALLFAGLLYPVSGTYIDIQRADVMFAELQTRDPDNGAYAFFRAYVLHKKNVGTEQVKNEFLKSFRALRFDSFITSITQRISEKSYGSSAYYYLAMESIRQMPIPNYNSVYNLLMDLLISSDVAFNKEAYNLGWKMMEPGLRAKGEREFVNWVSLEYAVGFNIVRYSSKVAYPDLPKKKYKDFFDPIPANLTELQTLFAESAENRINFEPAFKKIADPAGCLREDYDNAVKEDEQKYLNFLRQADAN